MSLLILQGLVVASYGPKPRTLFIKLFCKSFHLKSLSMTPVFILFMTKGRGR